MPRIAAARAGYKAGKSAVCWKGSPTPERKMTVPDYLVNLVQQYGLIAIFLIVMLEYACLPLPSEVVLPLSGAVAAQGEFSFLTVLTVSVAAGIAGSMLCYYVGRWGGAPLLNRLLRRFPGMQKGVEASRKRFERYAILSVCLCRVIPLCRTYISLVAGLSGQHKGIFAAASAAGILVWNAVLVGLGYFFSQNWEQVLAYYDRYKLLVIILAVAAAAALIVRRLLLRRRAAQRKDAVRAKPQS